MKETIETTVQVRNEKGLHLHVASLIANAANKYPCDVFLEKESLRVNAKSVMSLALLAAAKDVTLTLIAVGEGASAALEDLSKQFEDRFGIE